MAGDLAALDPKEIVVLTVVLLGLVPVAIQYRSRSKWFTAGYALLLVGALSTNLEALVLADVFNWLEHVGGVLGAGAVFLYAAYDRRKTVVKAGEETDG